MLKMQARAKPRKPSRRPRERGRCNDQLGQSHKERKKNGGTSQVLDLRRWRRDIFHSVSKPRSRCTQYGLAFAVLKLSFRIAQIGYLFPDVAASLQKQWVSPWSWCLRQMDGRRYRDLALESRSSPAELSQ